MTMKPETYVCIVPSPIMPLGSIAEFVEGSRKKFDDGFQGDGAYRISFQGKPFYNLGAALVEQNPECWSPIKENTAVGSNGSTFTFNPDLKEEDKYQSAGIYDSVLNYVGDIKRLHSVKEVYDIRNPHEGMLVDVEEMGEYMYRRGGEWLLAPKHHNIFLPSETGLAEQKRQEGMDWIFTGTATEDIKCGDKVEMRLDKGFIRRARSYPPNRE